MQTVCSGVAMEKAIVPLVEQVNPSNDAQYYYFKRSPSKAPFYELEDVVKDLSFALEDKERHGQKLPLIVLLDNGSTEEDIVALMQAKISAFRESRSFSALSRCVCRSCRWFLRSVVSFS